MKRSLLHSQSANLAHNHTYKKVRREVYNLDDDGDDDSDAEDEEGGDSDSEDEDTTSINAAINLSHKSSEKEANLIRERVPGQEKLSIHDFLDFHMRERQNNVRNTASDLNQKGILLRPPIPLLQVFGSYPETRSELFTSRINERNHTHQRANAPSSSSSATLSLSSLLTPEFVLPSSVSPKRKNRSPTKSTIVPDPIARDGMNARNIYNGFSDNEEDVSTDGGKDYGDEDDEDDEDDDNDSNDLETPISGIDQSGYDSNDDCVITFFSSTPSPSQSQSSSPFPSSQHQHSHPVQSDSLSGHSQLPSSSIPKNAGKKRRSPKSCEKDPSNRPSKRPLITQQSKHNFLTLSSNTRKHFSQNQQSQ